MAPDCKLCGKPISNVRGAWKEQVGWVSPKGAKGMTLAQQTGALAHDECVTLKRFGVNPEQQTLGGDHLEPSDYSGTGL